MIKQVKSIHFTDDLAAAPNARVNTTVDLRHTLPYVIYHSGCYTSTITSRSLFFLGLLFSYHTFLSSFASSTIPCYRLCFLFPACFPSTPSTLNIHPSWLSKSLTMPIRTSKPGLWSTRSNTTTTTHTKAAQHQL